MDVRAYLYYETHPGRTATFALSLGVALGLAGGILVTQTREPFAAVVVVMGGSLLYHLSVPRWAIAAYAGAAVLVSVGTVFMLVEPEPAFALHTAARRGNLGRVLELLDEGVDVNCTHSMGETPLHAAVYGAGDAESVKLLIARGADIDAKAHNGMTPLHWAAMHGNAELVRILLASGCDSGRTNLNGQTPLDLAIANSHGDIAQLLRQYQLDSEENRGLDGESARAE